MVELYGDFEVDIDSGFVRIPEKHSDYVYIVSEDDFGKYAKKVTGLFVYAFERGQSSTRRELRNLIGVK